MLPGESELLIVLEKDGVFTALPRWMATSVKAALRAYHVLKVNAEQRALSAKGEKQQQKAQQALENVLKAGRQPRTKFMCFDMSTRCPVGTLQHMSQKYQKEFITGFMLDCLEPPSIRVAGGIYQISFRKSTADQPVELPDNEDVQKVDPITNKAMQIVLSAYVGDEDDKSDASADEADRDSMPVLSCAHLLNHRGLGGF